jgi:hypothetical protein
MFPSVESSPVFDRSSKLLFRLGTLAVLFLSLFFGYALSAGNPYFWIALVAGIGLLAACFKWPNLFIALCFSYVAFGGLVLPRTSLMLADMNIYPEDLLKLLALLFIALAACGQRLELPNSRLMLPLAFFLGLAIAETFVGIVGGYPLRNIFRDVAGISGYLMVLIGYNVVRDRQALRRWATVLFVAGSLASAYAIAMRLLGIETVTGFEGSATASTIFGPVTRAYGLPGATAFYLVPIFIGTVFLVQRTPLWSKRRGSVLGVGVALCFLEILLLFGRTLFLGMLSGILVLGVAWSASRRVKLIMVGTIITLVVFILAPTLDLPYADEISDRYLSIIFPSSGGWKAQETLQGRQDELQEVWATTNAWEKIVGRGLGVRHLAIYAPREEMYHNSIAETILKMGVAGVVIYGWFIVQMVLETIKTLRRKADPWLQALYLALVAYFVATMVWGFGTAGMPFVASTTASILLGMALRSRELLQMKPGK